MHRIPTPTSGDALRGADTQSPSVPPSLRAADDAVFPHGLVSFSLQPDRLKQPHWRQTLSINLHGEGQPSGDVTGGAMPPPGWVLLLRVQLLSPWAAVFPGSPTPPPSELPPQGRVAGTEHSPTRSTDVSK